MSFYVCGFNMSRIYSDKDGYDEENATSSDDDNDDDNDENSRLFSHGKNDAETEKSGFRKFINFFKKRVKKTGLRLIMLVILNGLYLYIGGLIFYMLERKNKEEDHVKKHIEYFLAAIKKSHPTLFAIQNITRFVDELTIDDINSIHRIFGNIHDDLTKKNQAVWTLESSVFFATTVVTTIGYGNLAPETVGGRLFCVVYAIIGIPITLILLTIVGQILSKYINDLCNVFIKALRITFYPSYEYESVEDDGTDLKAPVWLAVSFIMIFISLDAFIYVYVEGWSFPIALYFLFISLTTIGFGDIVPQKTSIVWFNVLFLYIGLAAVSITINLLIANINRQYKKHKEKIKFVKKLEDEFGSKHDIVESECGDIISNNNTSHVTDNDESGRLKADHSEIINLETTK